MYALIAFPVLSLPNRISLALQAFMLGLFLDGVGRWGWAGLIEQTSSVSILRCISSYRDPIESSYPQSSSRLIQQLAPTLGLVYGIV